MERLTILNSTPAYGFLSLCIADNGCRKLARPLYPLLIVVPPTEKFAVQSSLAHQLRHLRIRTGSKRRSGFVDCSSGVRVPATFRMNRSG